jgi:aminopeptidase N
MRKLFVLTLAFAAFSANAQMGMRNADTTWKKIFRGSAEKINDLVHTKLDVRFDYDKSQMPGKAWITLKPHFYPTDSLTLDAKAFDIKKVAIVKGASMKDLQYKYDDVKLQITLDKIYKGGEQYTVYIEYTARPEDVKQEGSAAITDAKGLYFINPKGEDPEKPTQIWTQGETESSSCWFPTIDRPNQKTTEEIYMTVPAKYVTLSNGLLKSQKKNADGTRTDYWKMDLPHAPYLFFMGVGEYEIVKDKYKNLAVDYYVEKEYAPVAKKIFGNTPSMIAFFERILGVPYAWPKYAQIVGRDYVSGAMENTSATLHQETANQNARQLVDENMWEGTIAHELFHQWFGDLVTTESWSNITVNESFADYSELLWMQHKYGEDAAGDEQYNAIRTATAANSEKRDLVRHYYRSQEDVFDGVSYQKGGRILHMLRSYLGDSAFFKGLNVYLNTNKFKTGEAHQLRLAFEEASGRDLNWFFNQWYFGSGFPKLDIDYGYDEATKKASITVKQTQDGGKVFRMPVSIDVYEGANKKRHMVWITEKEHTFSFDAATKPNLINFDAEKVLLYTKKDNKTIENYEHQLKHAKTYADRREVIDYVAKNIDSNAALRPLMFAALNDPYFKLRKLVIDRYKRLELTAAEEDKINAIAKNDPKTLVRAAAVGVLGKTMNAKYADLYKKGTKDSSYAVAGESLSALLLIDDKAAIAMKDDLAKDAKGSLEDALEIVKGLSMTPSEVAEKLAEYDKLDPQTKFGKTPGILAMMTGVKDVEQFKKTIDKVVAYRNMVTPFFAPAKGMINGMIDDLALRRKAMAKKNGEKMEGNEFLDHLAAAVK